MDYFDLLHQAQMNDKSLTAQETRCYKTSFTMPKKTEKSRVSSANIKKFLARKEEEEKQKEMDAKKKKGELLALRAMDKKAHKRVQTMLKRTKSANKSVMEDAIDNYNTKDTLEGPKQCDEDDYGYVSQEASALYEKLMAKYEKAPVESLKQMSREVKDLQAAKDRVKAALDKEAEELLHPTRKRKRKHDEGEANEQEEPEPQDKPDKSREKLEEEKERDKEKPKKIPKKMPPPVDFFELMKIAAKKQHEPIMIEKKKVQEPERPMTSKEKLERQRELERQNRKNNPKTQSSSKPSNDKVPSSRDDSLNKTQSKSKTIADPPEPSKLRTILKGKSDYNSNNLVPQSTKKEVKFSSKKDESSSSVHPAFTKHSNTDRAREKVSKSEVKLKSQLGGPVKSPISPGGKILNDKPKESPPPQAELSDIDKEIALLMKKKQMLMEASKIQKNKSLPSSTKDTQLKPSVDSSRSPSVNKSAGLPPKKQALGESKNVTVSKSSDKGEAGVKSINEKDKLRFKNSLDKEKVNLKVQNDPQRTQLKMGKVSETRSVPSGRKFSPPRYGPPSRPPPSQMKKKPRNKRVLDSESEYDSEMDDFIDDGPEECTDYSRHIKEIFGYDKSRYSHVDEDECEEASYRTQMIEERRSAKIGLMEDLEDIQREKEEKARAKAKMMKRKMKS